MVGLPKIPDVTTELNKFLGLLTRMADTLDRVEVLLEEVRKERAL
ncbi:hypothetical protein SEA_SCOOBYDOOBYDOO_1 [Mycobacterium phage ScoobyDoobyDoo]|nr:hypothetical protein SEA_SCOOBYDOOBYDOO_1 [Mycobacterium phage ScoobyDoobyDoo]